MLLPKIFRSYPEEDWFDFGFPTLHEYDDVERKLYGKHAAQLMKTDIHENEDSYELDIDLPGFKKEDIKLSLENGYLVIEAGKSLEKEKKGKAIRKERYEGSMQRSFYVGEDVKEEDIKAKFEDGVLKLTVPKKEKEEVPEKRTILIE
ncbi:MAG: Hsp20/alpha crystallin family protein [Lachnospiraceae bacterium]|nr:Hsp20/alpha crystallin family protein [Lachnospiraceae bacterium]